MPPTAQSAADVAAAYNEILEMLQRGIGKRQRTKTVMFKHFYVRRGSVAR